MVIAGQTAISRTCNILSTTMENKCSSADSDGASSTVCYCDTELCNGASAKVGSVVAIITTIIAALAM